MKATLFLAMWLGYRLLEGNGRSTTNAAVVVAPARSETAEGTPSTAEQAHMPDTTNTRPNVRQQQETQRAAAQTHSWRQRTGHQRTTSTGRPAAPQDADPSTWQTFYPAPRGRRTHDTTDTPTEQPAAKTAPSPRHTSSGGRAKPTDDPGGRVTDMGTS